MYHGDVYYDESWSAMSEKEEVKLYLVVIRQPRLAGPTIWAGDSKTTSKRDIEGWTRIKDTIERKLTIVVGDKPEWMKVHNAFKVPLTEKQVAEIKLWGTDVRSVIEFTK